jgi:excisionase family DNA binding protein
MISSISNGVDMAASTTARDTRALATRAEVAEYLGVPTQTLGAWAYQGTGPKYRRIGRHARYRWSDVDSWLANQPTGGDQAS